MRPSQQVAAAAGGNASAGADGQAAAPYLDAVRAFGLRVSGRFHTPGHKGDGADPGLLGALGSDTLLLDIPLDIDGIASGEPPTIYDRAEQLAAASYGAARAWFLTNGATQGNHALCLALAPLGARVVIQRNSHGSVIDGLVLSGGMPGFVSPEYDVERGIAHCVTPAALAEALERCPGAVAAFIVSPTYYGMAADIAGCAEVAHAAGAPLVVDCSWGAHFGFHPALPHCPLGLGADAMLASTHKIVGSLTQSAMLLVSDSGRVDPQELARIVRLLKSTSPSALLLASLDGARRQLAIHGQALIDRTIEACAHARTAISAVEGCCVVGEELVGQAGIAGFDPLRIVIDVRGTGATGYQLADALRATQDVHVELASHATIVLVIGIAQPLEPLERFAADLASAVAAVGRGRELPAIAELPTEVAHEPAVSPREAFLGPAEAVAVADAVGRVSCEAIAGYPPGVPTLLPGERITAQAVAYLSELAAAGARLHGAVDPTFATVRVLV
jgi:arginine decarboxylase